MGERAWDEVSVYRIKHKGKYDKNGGESNDEKVDDRIAWSIYAFIDEQDSSICRSG